MTGPSLSTHPVNLGLRFVLELCALLALAYFWHSTPAIDREAFAIGVSHHDRGYGPIDTMAIGEVDETIWLATQRRGIQTTSTCVPRLPVR